MGTEHSLAAAQTNMRSNSASAHCTCEKSASSTPTTREACRAASVRFNEQVGGSTKRTHRATALGVASIDIEAGGGEGADSNAKLGSALSNQGPLADAPDWGTTPNPLC